MPSRTRIQCRASNQIIECSQRPTRAGLRGWVFAPPKADVPSIRSGRSSPTRWLRWQSLDALHHL